jgi:hypothetical protein
VEFAIVPSAGWIVVDRTSGTTPAQVTVAVAPSIGPLASGNHSGAIGLTATYDGEDLAATVQVSAALTRPRLTTPASLVLGGQNGTDVRTQAVLIALDTGGNAFPWTAVASDPWMSLPAAEGTVSATPVTLDVVPVATGLTSGTRTGAITFSATVHGDTVEASVPVIFNLDAHELRVSAQGVAFTSTPGVARTTRTLRVGENVGAEVPWAAASDRGWLSVTPSGTTPADLVLSADPAGLAPDTLHLAEVTITSTDPSIQNAETVRVGLWIGSTAPSAAITVAGSFTEIAADPVRPYAYAHSGGSAVTIHDIHTGASVGTIGGVGTALGAMTVSGDGSRLYVVDTSAKRVVPVDLDTRTVGASWSMAATSNTYPRVSWTRTNGLPVLVVADGTLRDPDRGTVLGTFVSSGQARVATSADGTVFCAPYCRSLSFTQLGGGALTSAALKGTLDTHDGALSPDGSIVYVTAMSGYHWLGYSTATGETVRVLQSGKPYPGNVEVGWDGRIYAGRYGSSYEPDVYIFDAEGAEVGSLRVATSDWLRDGELVLSGDGLRLVAVAGYSSGPLRFLTLP